MIGRATDTDVTLAQPHLGFGYWASVDSEGFTFLVLVPLSWRLIKT